jgi:hypothetical protein
MPLGILFHPHDDMPSVLMPQALDALLAVFRQRTLRRAVIGDQVITMPWLLHALPPQRLRRSKRTRTYCTRYTQPQLQRWWQRKGGSSL